MKWLRQPSLARRLLFGFGLVIALLLAITALALDRLQFLHERIQFVADHASVRAEHAQAMLNTADEAAIALYGFALAADAEDVKAQRAQFDQALQRYQQSHRALRALLEAEGADQVGQLQPVDKAASATLALVANLLEAIAQGGNPLTVLESLDPRGAVAPWRSAIGQLVEHERTRSRLAAADAASAHAEARQVLLAFAAAALLVGIAASWLILRSVARPLQAAIRHARAIATGDLTRDISAAADDETGALLKALAHMQSQLKSLVASIQTGTNRIDEASGEIASGNQNLSLRTEISAAHIQQTAAMMTGLSDMLNQSASEASQTSELTGEVTVIAQRGRTEMTELVQRMEEVQRSSERISEITHLINAIAAQTTILALNAAVEAARAGEQGRGFAVVAGEIRTLATRTADASREIEALIEASVNAVRAGSNRVKHAGQTMSSLAREVHRASQLVLQLSTNAVKQSREALQAREVLLNLDQSTQQNAALVEQTAAAAQTLRDQAARLDTAAKAFRT